MSAAKIRTGVFGGSFNPIHNGHVALARRLLGVASLDEVWFVVSPRNPLKEESQLADDRLRLEMVRIALEDEPRFVACDYEFGLPRPSYMWHTLQGLAADCPDREFVLIIGSDNWACFDEWFAHDDIISSFPIVIYPRPGYAVDAEALSPKVTLADVAMMDISSTDVRRRIASGMPVEGMLPHGVWRFIVDNHLYGAV